MKNEARIALSLSMLAAAVLALVVWSARPLASAPARAPEPLQPSAAREPLAPAEHWEADPGATTPSARIEVAAPDLDWTLLAAGDLAVKAAMAALLLAPYRLMLPRLQVWATPS